MEHDIETSKSEVSTENGEETKVFINSLEKCIECDRPLESYKLIEIVRDKEAKGLNRTIKMRASSNLYEAFFEELFRPITQQDQAF